MKRVFIVLLALFTLVFTASCGPNIAVPRKACSSLDEVKNQLNFSIDLPDTSQFDPDKYEISYFCSTVAGNGSYAKPIVIGYQIIMQSRDPDAVGFKRLEVSGTNTALGKYDYMSQYTCLQQDSITVSNIDVSYGLYRPYPFNDKEAAQQKGVSSLPPNPEFEKYEGRTFTVFDAYVVNGDLKYSITISDISSNHKDDAGEMCLQIAKDYFTKLFSI